MASCDPYGEDEVDDDYLDWSDDDNTLCTSRYVVSSSSDEEMDNILQTFKAKKIFKKVQEKEKKDDFEREMDSELSTTLKQLQASFSRKSSLPDPPTAVPQSNPSTSASSCVNNLPEDTSEFYDDVYFDSDESEGEESSRKKASSVNGKSKRRIPTNDELFYDPEMDDRDQEWMDKKRRSYQVRNKKRLPGSPKGSKNPQALPESDAVLNCPACLTMLCMDCQRHEIYHNQYWAMFVFNCNIKSDEVLRYPKKSQKKKDFFKNKKMKKSQEKMRSTTTNKSEEEVGTDKNSLENSNKIITTNNSSEDNSVLCGGVSDIKVSGQALEVSTASNISGESNSLGDELFHPVTCGICNTKVAVYDKDEVYHFFNIVTSY